MCTHMCLIRAHPCYYVGVDDAALADGVKKHQNPRISNDCENQPGLSICKLGVKLSIRNISI